MSDLRGYQEMTPGLLPGALSLKYINYLRPVPGLMRELHTHTLSLFTPGYLILLSRYQHAPEISLACLSDIPDL